MENQPQPESAPAKNSSANEAQLLAEIESKRKQLGYDKSRLPVQISLKMPAREFTPESEPDRAALEQAEMRRALSEQRAAREGWLAQLSRDAGSRYASCSLENFAASRKEQQAVVGCVRDYCETLLDRLAGSEGIVFFGPCGTGKDHLAFVVAAAAISDHGRLAGWLKAQAWFGELRDNMDAGRSEKEAIEKWCRQSLLVISDPLPPFGPLTQHQATMLYRLVTTRYDRCLTTIVTANVADDREAKDRLGVPTWDRLCHNAWKIHCNWPSYRKPRTA